MPNMILLLLGLLLQIQPYNWIIGKVMKRWLPATQLEMPASRYIGPLERIIIYIFVWHGSYEAISFVITGKAILRFADASKREHSEYILVGTLLSTTLAMLTGEAAKFLTSKLAANAWPF